MNSLTTASKSDSLHKQSFFKLMFMQLRPKQWTKNLLVFAALLFSLPIANLEMLYKSIIGFVLFCLVSGVVYVLNDYMDLEQDRKHPEKKHRPMASGALNPKSALVMGCVLLIGSLVVAGLIDILFMALLLIYFIINVFYSIRLKHVVIVDIMIIASGFVLRALGGGLVIGVPFTPWFLLCTLLLALFLAVSKRKHEMHLLQNNKGSHRKVLEKYSPELLNQLNSIVTTATIMSYALFTFTSNHSVQLMWTIPIVIYGVFRYLYLIHMEDKGGSPERVLLEDKHILFTVVLYAITVIIVLTVFE
jgi:4-hydroxybenzoate polyprenyltransferase